MILLTGATGKTGSATAIELSNLNVPFRALIRSEEKRAQIEALGGEVIIGSAEDRETIAVADPVLPVAPVSKIILYSFAYFFY